MVKKEFPPCARSDRFWLLIRVGCAALLCAYVAPVFSETPIEGDISAVTFSNANNPYIVNSEITVPDGKKAVISAGCVLLFKESTRLNVTGSLEVNGDSASPVIFTAINDQVYNKASAQSANPFDWNGIHIERIAGKVSLKNFRLMFSVYGINCESNQLTIENGVFRQNGRSNAVIKGKQARISDNEPVSLNIVPEEPAAGPTPFFGKGDATLYIETEPSGAIITVENKKIDKTSPLHIDSIQSGQYVVKAQRDLLVGTMNVAVGSGEIKKVFIKLERQKTILRVLSEPSDAQVFMDKKITKRARPDFVTPGVVSDVPDKKTLLLSFYKYGFKDTSITLALAAHQVNNVYLEMKAATDAILKAQKAFERKRKLARLSKYLFGAAVPCLAASGVLFYSASKDNNAAKDAKIFLDNTVERQGPAYEQKLRENDEKASSGNRKDNAGIICGAAGVLLLGAGLVFYF